ncbi:2-polyprenyl-3-methyl-5-hydroxy-6-metoxy-1,4-benzoquinol methylase [Microbacterium sp. cf046]|uniref:methyltransferase domain-containing protein n=1 Tax=Microbacterium sp. cf046 TaxID=1761803 RepID=UPI0008E52F1F|nr:methyltransferase domain-containing protein [Microbacterium sp. cf046]SFR86396.1 2-polyprenyl-3-methyl-5-hydroxy-6-metoxy-1,4-benzoquinol methylase [Microbacterium sp. cf046]
MSLAERDVALRELMDDPECDPELLRATLRRFDTINRVVSGWGHIYRSRIRPYLSALDRPARVLDLGCGGGDVMTHLAGRAERDGLRAEWIGVDPDPRAIEVATARDAPTSVRFVCTDSSRLLADGERFDLVLSNHVLHHLSPDDLDVFTDESRRLSQGLVMHGDIERGRVAYGLYTVWITPFAPGTFLRTDGLRSIRRSYRQAELADVLGSPWRIERPFPFRVLAVAPGLAGD